MIMHKNKETSKKNSKDKERSGIFHIFKADGCSTQTDFNSRGHLHFVVN